MDFKIKRLSLLNALAKVTRAVSLKSPLPVLTGIKFELTAEELILTGSDTDITIQTTIKDNIQIFKEGNIVLSSKYIFEIVRKIDAEELHISIIDGCLVRIQGNNSIFDLNGTPASEYPRINLNKDGLLVELKGLEFKECIEQTSFATSEKETRPVLTGVNFKAENGKLDCTATDSYRLAKKEVLIDTQDSFNIIIPKKSLLEISRLIEKECLIDLYISDRKMICVVDNIILLTRLIDGTYPDTNRLIPNDFLCELSVDSSDLLNSIDRASLLSTEQMNTIKLSLSADDVIISSSSQELGSVEDSLTKAFYKGEPLSISFSGRYLTEAIKSINSDKVKLYFNGDMKPFIVKNLDEDNIIQLILPVRTY